MEEAAVMPVPSQEFCLRWNNYHTSLVTSLDSFKNDKDFVDVTLACEGTYLMAHKMLLSACSVFFRDIIKVNPCAHPIIILPQEVRLEDMEKLLRFIYQGEVNVLQENLPRFLKTAEMLKIRGLAEDGEKQKVLQTTSPGDESPCPSNSNTSGGECSGTSPKRPRLSLDTTTVPVSTGANTVNASTASTCSSNSGVSCGSSLVTTNSSCSAPATLVLDGPNTPNNNEDSTHSGNDSDSEMLPVKQEMVELKSCEEFETDGEPFNPDKYLKDGVVMTTTCNDSHGKTLQQPPPPPPGPLMPSYVPPPPIKAQEGPSRASGQQPVGGLIRRFLEECLQLPAPAPLLSAYTGLEGTPHFQLLRSVAKEWSYCRNATQNYTTMGGKSKRQRATSRLIETFENIDALRSQLSQLKHQILVMEVNCPGILKRVCKAEAALARKQREQQQREQRGEQTPTDVASCSSVTDNVGSEEVDVRDVSPSQQEVFAHATDVMKQLRKLYFDQSRRLAVRISQLKKGRQVTQERIQRQQQNQMQQQNYVHQALQQQQQQQQQQHHHHQQQQHQSIQQQHQQQQQMQQMQQQLQLAQDGVLLPHQLSLHHLHQPWSD